MSRPWIARLFGDFLRESRIPGSNGTNARKLTVRLYGRGVVEKEDIRSGSENTKYFRRRAGQLVYSKLDFLNGAFALISPQLDGRETTLDLPAFDIDPDIDPGWLIRFVTRSEFYKGFAAAAKGSRKARRVNPEEFLGRGVLVPSLGEQRKVVSILSAVEDTIEATKAVIDQLEVLMKTMTAELLTRGLPGRHTRFKETEIGEVPEDWEVVPLESVLIEGPTNGLYKPAHFIGRGALIAGMSAIDGNTLRWGACRRAELEPVEAERFGLRQRDILVTRVYARIDGVGRFIIVPDPPECAVYESNMMRIRIDPRLALPEFVASHMGLAELRKKIEQRATLGAQASINNAGIRTLPLRLPPLHEQMQIVDIIASLHCRENCENEYLDQLTTLKTGLTSALLTGELRVNPDETTP